MPVRRRRPCQGPIVDANTANYTAFVVAFIDALRSTPLATHGSLCGPGGGLTCARADASTDWLEFGVWKGYTAKRIANYRVAHLGYNVSLQQRPALFGFDSFAGLPERWRTMWVSTKSSRNASGSADAPRRPKLTFKPGYFAVKGGAPPTLDGLLSNESIRWVVGWFHETLPRFLAANSSANVSLLHVDCDLYNSTRAVLRALRAGRRLHPGALLVLDEAFGYPEYQAHELRALWEFLAESDDPPLDVELIGTSTRAPLLEPRTERNMQSCALRLVERGARRPPEADEADFEREMDRLEVAETTTIDPKQLKALHRRRHRGGASPSAFATTLARWLHRHTIPTVLLLCVTLGAALVLLQVCWHGLRAACGLAPAETDDEAKDAASSCLSGTRSHAKRRCVYRAA